MYFKLIAWQSAGVLRARAFVVTQELLLEKLSLQTADEAATLTPQEIALYEVSIPALEKLTDLRFGLPTPDALPAAARTASRSNPQAQQPSSLNPTESAHKRTC